MRLVRLEKDKTGVLFISIDTGDISEKCLPEISQLTKIPERNIFLTVTHTHESPYVSRSIPEELTMPYKSKIFAQNTKKAIIKAIQNAKTI